MYDKIVFLVPFNYIIILSNSFQCHIIYTSTKKHLACLLIEASRGAGAQGVTVKLTVCGFDPHSRRCNIYLNLYFYFFALVSRTSAALSSATQHATCLQNSAESGERSV